MSGLENTVPLMCWWEKGGPCLETPTVHIFPMGRGLSFTQSSTLFVNTCPEHKDAAVKELVQALESLDLGTCIVTDYEEFLTRNDNGELVMTLISNPIGGFTWVGGDDDE